MKKRLGFLMVLVLVLCCTPALCENIKVSVPIATGTGYRASGSFPPVTPFASVRWGDSVETVAAAVSGETVEQEGETVVRSMGEITGLAAPVPVTWYFRDGGLVRAEAVIANNLSKKIEKLSESGTGKPVNSATREFFHGLTDCYFWNDDQVLLYMAKESNASLRCRGEKSPYSLSLTYYQPEIFAAEKFGAIEGIVFQETGEDAQYNPYSPKGYVTPFTVNTPTALTYLVAVKQYQNPVRRIPFFSLSLYYAGNTDLGDGEKFSFLIDGKEYTFTGLDAVDGGNTGTEIIRVYNTVIGEHSLPFWDALEKTENPVNFTFKGSKGTLNFNDVSESTLEQLKDGFRQYRELNGFSGMALDYASGGESPLIVMEMETILDTKAAYTMDQSVLPFAEMDWKVNANKLAKDLGVKAEREGNVSRVQSVVSIENLGTDLPVTYTFRNNKLSAVVITLRKGIPNDAGFFDTIVGRQFSSYISSFIADHKKLDYTSKNLGMKYTRTDVTDICWGIVRNGSTCDLALEFYPAQSYDVTFLQKNKKIGNNIVGQNDVMYYDNNPFYFSHAYTYNGYHYTYSCFNWVIQIRNAANEVSKIPTIYYYFYYAGVKDSSSAKWITFSLDGVLYRFELKSSFISKLSKTQYGELTQSFSFFMDASGYSFLEQLAKARKVIVTLQGDNFMLNFDLPGQAKNKILEGKKQYDKVCGLIDGPLAFGRFDGAPMTVQ